MNELNIYKKIINLITVLSMFVVIFAVILASVPLLVDFLEGQGLLIETTADSLSFVALIVALAGTAFTVVWSYWQFSRTSDIYQPVASAIFSNFPPYGPGIDETIIAVTNKGRRNLKPSDVHLVYGWNNQRVDIESTEYDEWIAPDETVDMPIRIDAPVESGTYKIHLYITCSKSGIVWKKTRSFKIPSLEDIISGKS